MLKVASVIFTIAGVITVSFFGSSSDHSHSHQNQTITTNLLTDDPGVRNTPMGYVVSFYKHVFKKAKTQTSTSNETPLTYSR